MLSQTVFVSVPDYGHKKKSFLFLLGDQQIKKLRYLESFQLLVLAFLTRHRMFFSFAFHQPAGVDAHVMVLYHKPKKSLRSYLTVQLLRNMHRHTERINVGCLTVGTTPETFRLL